ncbi:MAG: hypothetical protein V2J55_19430 [Candidatus Competibacteraceae bacterium]|jgi:hypothetical protein|nr:hypothetical protein [Candidatus Competibacteraceae bacterium]
MSRQTRLVITAVLALFCFAMSALVVNAILNPPKLPTAQGVNPSNDSSPLAESMLSVQDFAVAPLDDYADIIERPLFLEARRPPDPEQEEIAEPEAPAPSEKQDVTFLLQGVLVTPESTMALLRVEQDNKVVRLRVGEKEGDWQVESIQPDSVSLRSGEEVVKVSLVRNKPRPKRSAPTARRSARDARIQALRERRAEALRRRQAARNATQKNAAQNNDTVNTSNPAPQEQASEADNPQAATPPSQ